MWEMSELSCQSFQRIFTEKIEKIEKILGKFSSNFSHQNPLISTQAAKLCDILLFSTIVHQVGAVIFQGFNVTSTRDKLICHQGRKIVKSEMENCGIIKIYSFTTEEISRENFQITAEVLCKLINK